MAIEAGLDGRLDIGPRAVDDRRRQGLRRVLFEEVPGADHAAVESAAERLDFKGLGERRTEPASMAEIRHSQ